MLVYHVIVALPKAAGTTVFVENIVREQRTLGHTIEVCTSTNFQPTPNLNALIPAIIHLHGLWSPLLHRAAHYARRHHIPIVWSTHGMTAPWSLHHKWWKKVLPWYLYQLPDLRRAALIHCTTELEADWNLALGFKNVFVVPLGTTLPTGRACCPQRAAIDLPTNEALARDCGQSGCCLNDRRTMAEKKVAEWLEGVDDATFNAALAKLVADKMAAGEYLFEKQEDFKKAMSASKNFFDGYSRRIVELSDGRCVYFAPDPRSRLRNADNSICWAEYAFHAVSSGGGKIPEKNYHFRKYNEYKVINTNLIESTLKSERCVPVLREKCSSDSIKFFGPAYLGGLFDVVVRLDEYGNGEANMTEVTFEANKKHGQRKLPQFVSLTGAIRTVVSHQTATGTYPPNRGIISNSFETDKGGKSTFQTSQVSPRTLLYVGRIYPVKALDNAIRAVALMKQPIILRIVGPDQAGHMAELMAICDSLHLPYTKPGEVASHPIPNPQSPIPSQVQFIGPKYDDDLDREYRACDGLILVSHTENFGATVVDAMAHGKPVITSTKTPWKIVSDKGCGWWVDNAPEALAKVFDEFAVASTSDLNLLGQRGLALVQAEYTWPAIACNLISHYAKLVPNDNDCK